MNLAVWTSENTVERTGTGAILFGPTIAVRAGTRGRWFWELSERVRLAVGLDFNCHAVHFRDGVKIVRNPGARGTAITATVSFSSGQMHCVRLRRACNKHLRAAVHLWANLSRSTCAWAEAYYQQKRSQKMSHARALRCLGQRWLKILWKMWQTHTPYNEALHTLNQTRHGSWVVALLPSTTDA